jgi:hypothetical protein
MRQSMMMAILALIAGVAFQSVSSANEPKKPEAKPENKLVGTWQLVSAKYDGKDVKFPEGSLRLKHVTPTHFIWTNQNADGIVDTTLGGRCTVQGNKYEEVPEFGTEGILKSFKGELQKFEWKIDGDKWHHTGKLSFGLEIEEVWVRVKGKED